MTGMLTPYGFDRVSFDESGKEVYRIERGTRFRFFFSKLRAAQSLVGQIVAQ